MARSKLDVEPKPLDALRRLCSVVANDLRRAILWSLLDGPHDVSTLAKEHGRSMNLVSNSLKQLHGVGLVTVQRDARRRIYSLSDKARAIRHKNRRSLVLEAGGGAEVMLTPPRDLSTAKRDKNSR